MNVDSGAGGGQRDVRFSGSRRRTGRDLAETVQRTVMDGRARRAHHSRFAAPRMSPVRIPLLVTVAMGAGSRGAAQTSPQDAVRNGLEIAAQYKVGALDTRRFTHDEFWTAVQPSLDSGALRVAEIGRSLQGRPIRAVTFGRGPVTVLLWSQIGRAHV